MYVYVYMYNTLQHTATHCNTLQHTATHCNTPCFLHPYISIRVCICIYVVMISSNPTMGWLGLVGSLKLYVSWENIGLFCRALVQKRPIILTAY